VNGIQTTELWCVDLVAGAPALHAIERRTPRLSPADHARAAAFSHADVRAEWLATHIALRLLIERAAGRQWRCISFDRSERGKPHLGGTQLAFSLSHAPGLALIGLAPCGAIGVDIERTRPVRIGEARRARIEDAGAALIAGPLPSEGNARFLQAWVRLEAYAKADGCGIGRLLTRLGILGTRAAGLPEQTGVREIVAKLVRESPDAVANDLQLGDGIYAAAVFAGTEPPAEVAWLPSSVEGLEKLTA
jgi:4'-phosphopantetheinyl transferase